MMMKQQFVTKRKCAQNHEWEQHVWRTHNNKWTYSNTLGKLIIVERCKFACARNHRNRNANATVQDRRNRHQLRIVKMHSQILFFPQSGAETIENVTFWKLATRQANRRGTTTDSVGSWLFRAFISIIEAMLFLPSENKWVTDNLSNNNIYI